MKPKTKNDAKDWAKPRATALKAQGTSYGLFKEIMEHEAKQRGYDKFNISYHHLYYYKSRKQS